MQEIEKEFGVKGKDPLELFEKGSSERKQLSGDLEKDAEILSNFLSRFGFEVKPKEIKQREGYKEAVKSEIRFLIWLIELIFWIIKKVVEVKKGETSKAEEKEVKE